MPGTGHSFSNTLNQRIEGAVKTFLKAEAILYNFFRANNLVRKIEDGQDDVTYFDEKETEGFRMASTIHNANVITPEFGETRVGLLKLAGRIQISMEDVDKFRANQFIGGDLIQRTVNAALRVGVAQMEQFLAWGDEMREPISALDQYAGTGTFTGIFNGGTAIGGGEGGDEDMQQANDYLATTHNMRKALRAAGHMVPEYALFSDQDSQYYSTVGNNFYSNVGVSEYQRVLDLPYINNWYDSPYFIDASLAKYRMAMVCPRQRTQGGWGAKGIQKNLELIVGYDWKVIPEHNGGLHNGYYHWLIVHSMRLVEYHSTAIQRTGTLTLTS
jgi:hypothetical protein